MKTIIVDLDNCISDDRWRLDRIKRDEPLYLRYSDYHDACMEDELRNEHIFKDGYSVAIITGRPTTYMAQTIQWLVNKGVKFDHLIMRNLYDHAPTPYIKRRALGWLFAHYGVSKDDIVCAYDDRQDVVDMYIEEGLKAEVLAIHPHRTAGEKTC